jgi:hypothetical protein
VLTLPRRAQAIQTIPIGPRSRGPINNGMPGVQNANVKALALGHFADLKKRIAALQCMKATTSLPATATATIANVCDQR